MKKWSPFAEELTSNDVTDEMVELIRLSKVNNYIATKLFTTCIGFGEFLISSLCTLSIVMFHTFKSNFHAEVLCCCLFVLFLHVHKHHPTAVLTGLPACI